MILERKHLFHIRKWEAGYSPKMPVRLSKKFGFKIFLFRGERTKQGSLQESGASVAGLNPTFSIIFVSERKARLQVVQE